MTSVNSVDPPCSLAVVFVGYGTQEIEEGLRDIVAALYQSAGRCVVLDEEQQEGWGR